MFVICHLQKQRKGAHRNENEGAGEEAWPEEGRNVSQSINYRALLVTKNIF